MTSPSDSETPNPTRRKILKRGLQAAAGLAVVVAGGGVFRAVQEDIFSPFNGPAYEPWTTWKTDRMEGPLALVQMAILAANPHNTQPWRFRVLESRIDLFADRQRHLGTFDPYRREMQIGLGCAIENLTLTARAHGYDTIVEIVGGRLPANPETTGIDRVATLLLAPGAKKETALYRAIANRHTDRFPYDRSTALPEKLTQALTGMATAGGTWLDIFTEGAEREAFDELMTDATHAIVEDPEMVKDSHRWFRSTNATVQALRDGVTLDAAGLPLLLTVAAKILPDPGPQTEHRLWEDATRDSHLASAPATGLISVRDRYGREDNIAAGRVWQRLHLFASTLGLSMHPMNQPIEWADRQRQLGQPTTADRRLGDLIRSAARGALDWQPTFAFRMGYPTQKAPPSPRRPVEDCLVRSRPA